LFSPVWGGKEGKLMRNLIDLVNAIARLIAEIRKAVTVHEHSNRG
jgi:hypothetical protein